jgi:hypothetical protein
MLTELSETEKQLKAFRDYVIKQSKSNLTRLKKNSSKKLYDSIKGEYKVMPNSFSMDFSMADYGMFQDKGVNGKKSAWTTAYRFGTKMPPPTSLDKWIVRKGIAPRDTSGKFTGRTIDAVGFRKSIQFLIARSIFIKGIKPSLFFTKPFEQAFKKLPSELIEKFGLDAVKLFDTTIKQPIKK